MEEDIAAIVTYVVTLTSGKTKTHTYSVPTEPREITRLVKKITRNIVDALTGNAKLLYLEYPNVLYNPVHIACIEFDVVGAKELAEQIRKAQKGPLGFPRTGS